MPDDNVSTMRDFYAAVESRDLERAMTMLAPDVEVRTRVETYRGRDAVAQMLEGQFTEWRARYEIRDITEPAQGVVVVSAHLHMRGLHTGIEVEEDLIDLVTLRDGRVVSVVVHERLEEALAHARSLGHST